ncbi:MAG: hypothetical protein LBD23_16330 [Oscillospiraceae bacterium]|jgi:hypothetical protein|nr:hypothetical protein [Oscillospiraceae bacterium]
MVIRSYDLSVSSHRTFISSAIASPTISGTQNHNNAAITGATGQEGGTAAIHSQSVPTQTSTQQNQNGQGQNQNGQGQNGQGQNGQGQNGQGQNVNNVNNQGQNQNSQGQNVDNQGQSNGDMFKTMLKNARRDTVNNLSRSSPSHHAAGMKNNRIPTNPHELRANLSRAIYEMLTSRFAKLRMNHAMEHFGKGLDIFSFFGGFNNNLSNGITNHEPSDVDFGEMSFGGGFSGNSISMQWMQNVTGAGITHFQFESETVSYQASGVVHTADGKTISVDINMHMSRQFVSFMNISTDTRLPVDPLVINYGGTAASLMGDKFLFDLTMDGNLDSLSVLGEGNGFLAIDWDGDGKIKDGSQLFGPGTGCGFSELRQYDTDGNGWIDHNDEIFDKLVVWSRDKDGNDTVKTLKELGIGAIFLGDISTEFSFKDENNETLGIMRSTSFFLKQCGGAGTLSHIDLMLE